MQEYIINPDRLDVLSNAKIVLDCIESAGETKVTSGPITMDDVPSFIKNRYAPPVVRFIRQLMEAKRLKSIKTYKEDNNGEKIQYCN
jgi:hypothetical protein